MVLNVLQVSLPFSKIILDGAFNFPYMEFTIGRCRPSNQIMGEVSNNTSFLFSSCYQLIKFLFSILTNFVLFISHKRVSVFLCLFPSHSLFVFSFNIGILVRLLTLPLLDEQEYSHPRLINSKEKIILIFCDQNKSAI